LIRLIAFVCVWLVTGTAVLGQAPTSPGNKPSEAMISAESHVRPAPENYRFPNGTTYVYDAEWRLWRAGTVTLKIEAAGAQQRVVGTAESTGFVALLYRVHDRFQSLFDARSFCSASLSKHTEEGFRRRDTLIQFDYARRKAVLDEKNLKSGEAKHTENDIPGCVSDVLSGIYYAASLPLQSGTRVTFPLNDGGKTVDVKLHVLGREQVKTDAGTFQTIKVEPEASEGMLKTRGRIWIWYTDDASRIPVQMRARMFWGTLNLKLQRVEKQ
jgi:Protein of unknown function (DUF3108)